MSEFSYSQTPSNDPHWQLSWEDNFDYFDSNRWIKAQYCDHAEPQLYLPQNVFTANGKLIIKIENTQVNCPPNPQLTSWICGTCNVGNHNYSSGWIETMQLVQYGFLEARIKIPDGVGLFPAFWTWTGSPSYQEIDILEMTPGLEEYCHRNNSQKFMHSNLVSTSNIHYEQPNGLCDDPNAFPSVSQINDYTQWHTYAIEWSPSRIIWYIDDYPVRYIMNQGITAPTSVILNLAVQASANVLSSFPQEMWVEFVKLHELNSDCNDFINSTNYDFSTYNNVEKNYIKIGHGGGNNSLSVGEDFKLRASQFIEISGDFSVPVGASLYLDADKGCSIDLELKCSQTFNPCIYDFSSYDNTIKKIIDLGGNGCILTITPTTNDILLSAIDEISLKPGITITSVPGKSVPLKIISCN